MNKFINYSEFMHYLIDDEKKADKGGEIVKGLLAAKSPRLSNIAEQMEGQSESNYKAIHRFIGQTDVKEALLRLYQEKADFVIGDPTEMPRYKAPKTEYVGTLSDGQTPGYSRRRASHNSPSNIHKGNFIGGRNSTFLSNITLAYQDR